MPEHDVKVGKFVGVRDYEFGRVMAIDGDTATVHVTHELDYWGYPSRKGVTTHNVTIPVVECHVVVGYE